MITVGKAAKMFGLSRTALLYYDSIGLLKVKRADNGYRIYEEDDIERLRRIICLRDAGVPLDEISEHISSDESEICSILIKRLNDINMQIERSREQQRIIIRLLENTDIKQKRKFKTEEWLGILRKAGIEDGKALQWHYYFEKQSPEQHKKMLLSLGFSETEIEEFKKLFTET